MDAETEHDLIKENLLIEGLQDWIYLSWVHGQFLSEASPKRPPQEVQQLTLDMIRELVCARLFELGVPAGGRRNHHFEPWDMPLDEAMAKIEEAYVANYDDRRGWRTMCWLNLTDKGKELALELYHADEPGDA